MFTIPIPFDPEELSIETANLAKSLFARGSDHTPEGAATAIKAARTFAAAALEQDLWVVVANDDEDEDDEDEDDDDDYDYEDDEDDD